MYILMYDTFSRNSQQVSSTVKISSLIFTGPDKTAKYSGPGVSSILLFCTSQDSLPPWQPTHLPALGLLSSHVPMLYATSLPCPKGPTPYFVRVLLSCHIITRSFSKYPKNLRGQSPADHSLSPYFALFFFIAFIIPCMHPFLYISHN